MMSLPFLHLSSRQSIMQNATSTIARVYSRSYDSGFHHTHGSPFINMRTLSRSANTVCNSNSIPRQQQLLLSEHKTPCPLSLNYIYKKKNVRNISSSISPTTNDSKRPFQILGLQQVAVGSTDIESLRYLWMDILGLNKINTHMSEKENVIEDILLIAATNDDLDGQTNSTGSHGNIIPVELDLMCPINENKSPKVHKPPLNHIGLWVDNLPIAVEWMKSKGVRFTPGGIRKGAAGYDVTFIHPKGDNDKSPIGGCGVLIELVQAPSHIIEALKK